MTGPKAVTVLFACVHNAGRSQMAAAFFNLRASPARAKAISAGTKPAGRVHPKVVEVMREVGIDLSSAWPRLLTPELASTAQVLVTMGCGEACPVVPGAERHDWPLPDPKDQSSDRIREIRDTIREKVHVLIKEQDWG